MEKVLIHYTKKQEEDGYYEYCYLILSWKSKTVQQPKENK